EPSWCLRRNQHWLDTSSINHCPDEDGDGIGDGGIWSVWPACNFSGLSMWLYFCSSLTLTLYILAMEVSVSPRATMWLLPLPASADGSGAAVGVGVVPLCGTGGGAAAASPIITPGRSSPI